MLMQFTKEQWNLIWDAVTARADAFAENAKRRDLMRPTLYAEDMAKSHAFVAIANSIANMQKDEEPEHAALYIDAFTEHFADDECELAYDGVVSLGADPGAWVLSWTWVPNHKANIPDEEDELTEDDWKAEVAAGDTKLGFEEWLEHQKDAGND
jgi:hypothetical protein